MIRQTAMMISSGGGPTPGHPWCMTTAIGSTPVTKGQWHAVAFTYDGGAEGADFTVGAVYRSGSMGNFYAGPLGGAGGVQPGAGRRGACRAHVKSGASTEPARM
ncbi:hypothetical protein N0M98_29825 [Paenibacillus doosanensis]|uniref:hypothetical protein n=1 Tax=Paenibacillus doosanensis TaxID=1229154 RepID=UPI00218032C9|nr:hypothetical protein [Paenibacillus doosanensis]MCS7464306.1 hypothetical protein [Paenibacillus doosanensis]